MGNYNDQLNYGGGGTSESATAIATIVKSMQDKGVSAAGQAFMYGDRSISKPSTYVPDMRNPIVDPFAPKADTRPLAQKVAAGTLNFFKDTAKRTIGAGETAIREAIINPGTNLLFQATHNFQTQEEYFRNQAKVQYQDVANRSQKALEDYQSGKIDKKAYDETIQGIASSTGALAQSNLDQANQTALQSRQIKDWKTGQMKVVSAGDIIDFIDGAVTGLSLGTAGMIKGSVLQTAKVSMSKALGRDMIIDGLKKIPGVGIRTLGTASKVAGGIDKSVEAMFKIPGFREYADRQIAKLGADITAQKVFKNMVAEAVIHAPLRRMNMESARQIVSSAIDGEFLKTPEGARWLNSGAGQTLLMAGMALEGGPIGFIFKQGKKLGGATMQALHGDAAVSKFLSATELAARDKGIARLVTDEGVAAVLNRGSADFKGTYWDHVFRMADSEGNAANGWKWLAENVADNPELAKKMASIEQSIAKGEVAASIAATSVGSVAKELLAGGKEVNIQNVMDHMLNWQKAGQILEDASAGLRAAGKLKPGQVAVVIKFGREEQATLKKMVDDVVGKMSQSLKDAGITDKAQILQAKKDAALELIQQAVNKGDSWAQHDGLVEDIVNSINEAKTGKGIAKSIDFIDSAKQLSGVPTKLKNQLKELGYIVGLPDNVTHPFVSMTSDKLQPIKSIMVGEARGGMAKTLGLTKSAPVEDLNAILGDSVAQVAGASPGFSRVGTLLESLGIGANQSSKEAYRMVTTSAINHIDDAKIGISGAESLKKLQQYAEGSKTVNDLRQLTINSYGRAKGIKDILGISETSAKLVQQSIIQAHLDVPLHIIGLSDRLVSKVQALPGIGAVHRIYSRIQGSLRYTFNPFFRTQEVVETELLGQTLTGGKTPWLTGMGILRPQKAAQLDEIVAKMEGYRMLDNSMYGEAAGNVALGRITANISKTQKRSLGAVVEVMANKMTNGNVDELFANHATEVMDMIRPIVQYPTQSALNSNMAKMMNLAAFPSRYNVKVTGLAIKALSQQTPAVQAATINGLLNFSNWLKSDDGIKWQQTYADEIRVLQWLTPINSIQWSMKLLSNGADSYSDFGMLGGLPFGVFSQILEDNGVIKTSTPYVDPETGQIYSKKIPATLKGRASLALMDMLGSVFTYPGRTLGLPGKQELIRNAAQRVLPTGKVDFTTQGFSPADLSPQLQKNQKIWEEQYRKMKDGALPKAPSLQVVQPFNGVPQTVTRKPSISKPTKQALQSAKNSVSKAKRKKAPVDFQSLIR